MKQDRRSSRIITYLSACSLLIALAVSCQTRQEDRPNSLINSGKQFGCPTAERAPKHKTIDYEHSILVSITADTKVFVGRDPVAQEGFGQKVKAALATDPRATVFLRIDQLAKYDIVATVVDMAFESGADRVFFVVDQAAAREPDAPGFDYSVPVRRCEPRDSFVVTLKQGKNDSLEVTINNRGFPSISELVAILPDLMSPRPPSNRHIFLKPANDVYYRDVIAVLDGAAGSGMEYFSLWTPESSKLFPDVRPKRQQSWVPIP
ncbi:MAG TPA: biopolymer transporter ExbD [Blastocatellia bacterium]|jgi:biopolymer transport protein ExbD|nr:biopolymer transporter ExbD [Blastocatellia bacterium]